MSGASSASRRILLTHRRSHPCPYGDTIEVDGLPIRLQGVAAPEEGEPVGGAATKAMREMALGQQIRCVAICYNERRDLGAVIVEAGSTI